jgi:2-hydroxy-3-oxopropionate reductase
VADIGFIGLGIMGGPMCRNLLKAGHKVVVCNRSSAPVDRMVELGAARGASPVDVAERSKHCHHDDAGWA